MASAPVTKTTFGRRAGTRTLAREQLGRSIPNTIAGPLVLPDTWEGITEQSATRRFSTPRTFKCPSTTAFASVPMRQVPVAWMAGSDYPRK